MIEIYELDSDASDFVLQARYNDDQTVDGETDVARHIRYTIQNWSRDPAEDHERIEAVLLWKYSNARYQAVQS